MKRYQIVLTLTVAVVAALFHLAPTFFGAASNDKPRPAPTAQKTGETNHDTDTDSNEQKASDEQKADDDSDSRQEIPLSEQPLARRVPKNEQAYFLTFSDHGEFYRELRPGDRIDLIGTFDLREYREAFSDHLEDTLSNESTKTPWIEMTLLQNTTVLGIRPHPTEGESGASIALSLIHGEVRLLELAHAAADIRLNVRAPDEVKIHPVKYETIGALFERLPDIRSRRERRCRGGDKNDDSEPTDRCAGALAERLAANTGCSNFRAVRIETALPPGAFDCGDTVNVHGRFPIDEDGNVTDAANPHDARVTTLLRSVTVLGTTGDEYTDSLVLALKRDEARLLRLANRNGSLTFTLRNPGDAELVGERSWIDYPFPLSTTFKSVFEDLQMIGTPPQPPQPCPPRNGNCADHDSPEIEIIRGD